MLSCYSTATADIRPIFLSLSRDAMLARHVVVSVRLSVTSRYCTTTAKLRITQTTPYNSPGTSFCAKNLGKILTGSPPTRVPNKGGVGLQSAIFDQYLFYISKTVQDGDMVSGWLRDTMVKRRSFSVLRSTCS